MAAEQNYTNSEYVFPHQSHFPVPSSQSNVPQTPPQGSI